MTTASFLEFSVLHAGVGWGVGFALASELFWLPQASCCCILVSANLQRSLMKTLHDAALVVLSLQAAQFNCCCCKPCLAHRPARLDVLAQISEVEARQEEYSESIAFITLVNRWSRAALENAQRAPSHRFGPVVTASTSSLRSGIAGDCLC